MEYFDVVDCNGNKLGYKKTRDEKLDNNEFFPVISVLSYNSNKEILITRRSSNKSYPHLWDVTSGGILTGENEYDSVIRELLEEVGINVIKSDLLFISKGPCDNSIYRYFFICNISDKKIKIDNFEVDSYMFLDIDEFIKTLHKKDFFIPFVATKLLSDIEIIKRVILNK